MPRTALLVIDMQCGAFDGARCPPIDAADRLLAQTRTLVDAAHAAAVPIVFIQHDDTPGQAFERDTPHHALHASLPVASGDLRLRKEASSAFEGTALRDALTRLGATRLVLCGLQSELCVSNTARSALDEGFEVTIAQDAHGTWPSNGRSADAIIGDANDALRAAGARLAPADELVREFARRHQ